LLAYVFASALPPPKKTVFHKETVLSQKFAQSRARAMKKASGERRTAKPRAR
jgi:hypothetical protein